MTKDEFVDELDTIIQLVRDMDMDEDQLEEYVTELEEHDPDLADAVEDAFIALFKAAELAEQLKDQ